jgi:hypothetical protein
MDTACLKPNCELDPRLARLLVRRRLRSLDRSAASAACRREAAAALGTNSESTQPVVREPNLARILRSTIVHPPPPGAGSPTGQ